MTLNVVNIVILKMDGVADQIIMDFVNVILIILLTNSELNVMKRKTMFLDVLFQTMMMNVYLVMSKKILIHDHQVTNVIVRLDLFQTL